MSIEENGLRPGVSEELEEMKRVRDSIAGIARKESEFADPLMQSGRPMAAGPTRDLPMVRKTWAEFRSSKLLWWVNRTLHLFGWSIVMEWDGPTAEGEPKAVYPARVGYRGFDEESERAGFVGMTETMRDSAAELFEEMEEGAK